ncbi:MAG TPA: transporter associated domain-containing protein, partial [Devosiaceae bacterium]|nr:transporter associated domain-containing protein [Devosiaceae bacterium]
QVPKTLAIRQPEPVSLWIAYPLQFSYLALFPLNWLLNSASRAILRMLGVKEVSHQEILSDVEIDSLVGVAAKHGKMQVPQAEYIHNVFRFGELEVSDVMAHRTRMVTFDADMPRQDLINAILESPYTRIPLWRGNSDNIIGVIHAKDVLRALIKAGGNIEELDIASITVKPWFVPETTSVPAQLTAFLRSKTHFALIIDEYGEVEGLLTLEDILEEIVGDISDEHDEVMQGARKQPDGSYLVEGALPIRDLNRALGWTLPDEQATTIAGLVLHEAKTIPAVNQTFTFHGFRFRVTKKDHNRITELRISQQA